jgi:hypothetical protein
VLLAIFAGAKIAVLLAVFLAFSPCGENSSQK